MDDMPDLTADLDAMDIPELLEYQQSLTRARLAINERARETQSIIDTRVEEIAARRAAEDELLGQATKPSAQDLF